MKWQLPENVFFNFTLSHGRFRRKLTDWNIEFKGTKALKTGFLELDSQLNLYSGKEILSIPFDSISGGNLTNSTFGDYEYIELYLFYGEEKESHPFLKGELSDMEWFREIVNELNYRIKNRIEI